MGNIGNILSNLSFRRSIFNIVEYFTRYEMSNHAQKLIIYYFNESKEESSYIRAIEAIKKYLQEDITSEENLTPKLQSLLDAMSLEAKNWDTN